MFIAAVSKESREAFLLNAQLFTILRLEEQEDTNEALISKQSADTAYPLSQILAVVGAGKSSYKLFIAALITNSLPDSFHFGHGRVHWQRGPCYPTMARKLLVTKHRLVSNLSYAISCELQ